jgi:hypothetical protein
VGIYSIAFPREKDGSGTIEFEGIFRPHLHCAMDETRHEKQGRQ